MGRQIRGSSKKSRADCSGGAFLCVLDEHRSNLAGDQRSQQVRGYLSQPLYLATGQAASELLSKIFPENSLYRLSGPGNTGLSFR